MLLSIFKYLLISVPLLAAGGYTFLQLHPVFGGRPDAQSLARMQASKAWRDGAFYNLETTPLFTGQDAAPVQIFDWWLKMLRPPAGKVPATPLPSVPLDAAQLAAADGTLAWLGHATVLMRLAGKTIVTDPVFYNASPVPFTVSPFPMQHRPRTADMPPLDAVLISHDHYDHLDWRAIRELAPKTAHFYVPLGVRAHRLRGGVADEKITEKKKKKKTQLGDIDIIFVPARHFSGRRPRPEANTFSGGKSPPGTAPKLNSPGPTLWGGYVLQTPEARIYFSADSGYGSHYKNVIAKYGPFDFAMIECGAYNEKWALIHQMPEQAVQAALDVGAARAMPIHWGKFDLSEHSWTDPIERFIREATERGLPVATPHIGEVFTLTALPQHRWWKNVQ